MTRHDTITLNTTEDFDLGFSGPTATEQLDSGVGYRVRTAMIRALEASQAGRAARAQRVVDGHMSFHSNKALLDMGYPAQAIHGMRARNGH
jgi:hypothetical protein